MSLNLTPQEFIDKYYNDIKTQLSNRNIQVSKVGFIGYLLNILGFIQHDAKQYYDGLLKEAFPATSSNRTNLYFHSYLYKYLPPLAKSSHLVGNFEFLLNGLPLKSDPQLKRIILLKDIYLTVDDVPFRLLSDYTLSDEGSFYACQIRKEDNTVSSYNVSFSNPLAPLIDFKQVVIQTQDFTLPNYQYGYYYSKFFNLDNYLSDIEVIIDGQYFDIEFIKNNKTADDNCVFIRYVNNGILLEFGSGIHGKYVPGKNVTVNLYMTNGSKGNIGYGIYKPTRGTIQVIDKDASDNIVSLYEYKADNFINIHVERGEGGHDIISNDELRNNLIKHIQSRENFISKQDFYNIYSNNLKDFELLFKKTNIADNNIYLYQTLNNKYAEPYYTTSLTIPDDSTSIFNISSMSTVAYNNDNVPYSLYPEFIYAGDYFVSPFLYLYDKHLRTFRGYVFYDDYNRYFDEVKRQPNITENQIPANVNIYFDKIHNKTYLQFKSYQDISDYIVQVTSEKLNLTGEIMYDYNANIKRIEVPFFIDPVNISFKLYKLSTLLYEYIIYNVTPCMDIGDMLIINKYITQNKSYYLNIPCVYKQSFYEDKLYILNSLFSLFSNVIYPGNRMISDSLKVQFFNTYVALSAYLPQIVKQSISFSIKLPLKMFIEIVPQPKEYFFNNNININDEIYNFKLELIDILKHKYTGTNISLYITKIYDYIHNMPWVKTCVVQVKTNDGINLSDIETNDLHEAIKNLELRSKLLGITYTPVFWYWDLNHMDDYITVKWE